MPEFCCVLNLFSAPADQPQTCTVVPSQQEPGPQAPASDPHHDASQRPAPAHPNPSSGTGLSHICVVGAAFGCY